MKLAELKLSVDATGSLQIPADILKTMKIRAGEVYISYLTTDGEENKYRELFLSPVPVDKVDTEPDIQIAEDILQQAGISNNDEVSLVCVDGAVILYKDATLTAEELQDILNHLEVAVKLTEEVGSDPSSVAEELNRFCEYIEKGCE